MRKINDGNLPEYLTYDDVLLLPNYSQVTPSQTDVSTLFAGKFKLQIPIIASPMDTVCEQKMAEELAKLGGLGIIHRNLSVAEQAKQVASVIKNNLLVAAAVGVGSDFEERVKALIKSGLKIICIDSAHGHTQNVIEATKQIRKQYPKLTLIAGNIATYEGAVSLFKDGADVVKVGMGPGSICTTRVISGMGVPQLSAVVDCVRAGQEFKRQIIADGGIKNSGDIVKALAAGASTVMLGAMLAGTDEAPGQIVQLEGNLYKTYRGMGSIAAMKKGSAVRYGQKWQKGKTKQLIAEGVEGLVEHRGGLAEHLHQLIGGLKAGMGYVGAKNLSELLQKAQFIKITQASLIESHPHSLIITNPGKNYLS